MKRNENKGIALVSTIILIAIISILSGALLQMSYLTYSRKIVERRSTETFYTAEAILDTMKTAIQNSVASAIPSEDAANDQKTAEAFSKAAYKLLTGTDYTGAEYTITDTSALKQYLWEKIIGADGNNDDSAYFNGYNYNGGETATLLKWGLDEANGGIFDMGTIKIENNGIRITGVHIKFVNKQGYVAELKTDIVINAPIFADQKQVPVGSYSMFAGNGITVEGSDKFVYIHQEGNVYVGYDDATVSNGKQAVDTLTSLCLKNNTPASTYLSIGGEKTIFNGNIYILNGSTLAFTGGDGTKNAAIDVRGYIYLENGATLLLPQNVTLRCKGIFVHENGQTGKQYWLPYDGKNVAEQTVSQFYPFTESTFETDSEYTSYCNNSGKIAFDLLQKKGEQDRQNNIYNAGDLRYKNVWDKKAKCAVYILDTEMDTEHGFKNRAGDKYQLLTATRIVSSNIADDDNESVTYEIPIVTDWSWSCYDSNISKLLVNKIYCWPDGGEDGAINEVTKINYYGKTYDKEFASLINIQLLDLYYNVSTCRLTESNYYTNYNVTDTDTYVETDWTELQTLLAKTNGASDLFAHLFDAKALARYYHNYKNLSLEDRIFRYPTKVQKDSFTASGGMYNIISTVTDSNGNVITFSFDNDKSAVGPGVYKVNPSSNYALVISTAASLEVVPGYAYSGLFLAANKCVYDNTNGYCKGYSIYDLAENTKNNPGMGTTGNPVKEVLKTFAGVWIYKLFNGCKVQDFDGKEVSIGYNGIDQNSGPTEASPLAGIIIYDNLFNGGISRLWSTTATTSGGNKTANANGKDFVETDNWEKNPAEESATASSLEAAETE